MASREGGAGTLFFLKGIRPGALSAKFQEGDALPVAPEASAIQNADPAQDVREKGGQSKQGPDSQAPSPNQEQQRGQAQKQSDAGHRDRGQYLEAVAMFFRWMVDNIDDRIEPEGEKAEIDDQEEATKTPIVAPDRMDVYRHSATSIRKMSFPR